VGKQQKPGKVADGPFAALRDLREKLAKEETERSKPQEKPAQKGAPASSQARTHTKPKTATSAQEELDFHRLMSGVTPLDQKGGARIPRAETSPSGRRARPVEVDTTMDHLRVLVDEGSKFEVIDDGRRVEGHRVDVPPDFVRRLRRGGFPVDASLDLHGKTAAESQESVAAFLRDKRARGERCVLVIHGKGAHSPGGIGILRGEIAAWLSQGPASAHVAAFTTALEADGGDGALYILLRR
jgi:DNA-nicking Smr family endonuclease